MPGFWRWGVIPRPAAGIQTRRSYGFAPRQRVARKKSVVAASVPVTYGMSSRLALRLVQTATAPKPERIRHQKSIEPACPAQSAVNRYGFGRLALVNDATYLIENSCVKIAVHNPTAAR